MIGVSHGAKMCRFDKDTEVAGETLNQFPGFARILDFFDPATGSVLLRPEMAASSIHFPL
jgi:hypothetical protein